VKTDSGHAWALYITPLTTGQKFDNPPPGNKIEVLEVGDEPTQHIEAKAKNAFWRITMLFQF
jgi:hypothetical protein